VLDTEDSQASPAQRLIISQALQQAIAILKGINEEGGQYDAEFQMKRPRQAKKV
jgi:hypothetical protein